MISIETVTEQLRAYARKITHEPGTSAWKRELARYALRLRRGQHVFMSTLYPAWRLVEGEMGGIV